MRAEPHGAWHVGALRALLTQQALERSRPYCASMRNHASMPAMQVFEFLGMQEPTDPKVQAAVSRTHVLEVDACGRARVDSSCAVCFSLV